MEKWADVLGYEGVYQISDHGRVRSLDRYVTNKDGITRFLNGKLMKQSISNRGKGYMVVELRNNGERKRSQVHRLVAQCFLKNKECKPCVNHIDANPKNNHVDNLEWCTHKENMDHAFNLGLIGTQNITGKGEMCGASKLQDHHVIDIKKRIAFGERVSSIYKSYPFISISAIREIKAGRSWSHVGDDVSGVRINKGSGYLDENDVQIIKTFLKYGKYTQKDIGKMFGTSDSSIRFIKSNKNWCYVGCLPV